MSSPPQDSERRSRTLSSEPQEALEGGDNDQRFARLLRFSPYPNIPLKRVSKVCPDDYPERPSSSQAVASTSQRPPASALPGYTELLSHLHLGAPGSSSTPPPHRPEPKERRHDRTRKDRLTKYVDAVVARRKEPSGDDLQAATNSKHTIVHLMHFSPRDRSLALGREQGSTVPEQAHVNRPTVWLAQRDRRRSCREQIIFRVRDAAMTPKVYEGVTYSELMRYGPAGVDQGDTTLSPAPCFITVRLPCRLRPSSDGPEEVGITLGCECVEKSELYDLAVTVLHCYTQMLTRLEEARRLSQPLVSVLPHLRLFSLYTYHDGKEWYPEIGYVNVRN
ncbi:hypothetical protein EV714DRAFT_253776 [Schizophyllum commune]